MLLLFSLGKAQQITLDTSDTANLYGQTLPQGTIEQYWYWSWGFKVVGEGFIPNSEVTVHATNPNGKPWRNFIATSDASGNFSIQISAKKNRSILGQHIVNATDGTTSVNATLTVIANIQEVVNTSTTPNQLTLAEFANDKVTIKSTGLTPNAEVKINIFSPDDSGSEIDENTPKYADANGEFEMDINLFTPSYPWGDYMPEVPGKWAVTVHDFSSQYTNYGQSEFRVLPDNPSPSNYCTIEQIPSSTGQKIIFPITSFEIVGINSHNSSLDSESFYEDFTSTIFNLTAGETYTVKLKGINGSDFGADTYTIFIDWNQNGILDEENEVIQEGFIFGSTGEDDKFTEFQIKVPENALNGDTRLRILKVASWTSTSMYWPTGSCGHFDVNGQAEDYTLNIKDGLGVSDIDNSKITYYPNPVKDVFNLQSKAKIESIEVYDFSGKRVLSTKPNSEKATVDVSTLVPGAYIIKPVMNGKQQSIKIIKE